LSLNYIVGFFCFPLSFFLFGRVHQLLKKKNRISEFANVLRRNDGSEFKDSKYKRRKKKLHEAEQKKMGHGNIIFQRWENIA